MEQNITFFILYFILAFLLSLLINHLLLKFSKTLGIRNFKDKNIIRWNSEEKPSLGGISFYIVFLITIVSFAFLNRSYNEYLNLQMLGLFLAVTIGFLLGLFDDAYNTKPLIKLFAQILCAFILIVTGVYIDFFQNDIYNYLLTLFWVVGVMNSINMLDNMDGITSVVSLSIIFVVLTSLVLQNDITNPLFVILLGPAAALTGFLFYNWNPAKMFMGDTGSQFLGVFLASIAILFFWNGTDINGDKINSMNFMLVVIAFSLPIIDTTTVFIKRIKKGSSPFVGGKDHTTHHLSYIGLSEKKVALVFLMFSLMSFLMALFIINFVNNWSNTHFLFFGLYFVLIFLVLFIIANKNPK